MERQKCKRCKVNLTVDKFNTKRCGNLMKNCIECNEKMVKWSKERDSKEKWLCEECGKCFSSKSNLRAHKKFHIDDRVACEKCGFYHESRRALSQHKTLCECDGSYKWKDGKYVCNAPNCGYFGYSPTEILSHYKIGNHIDKKYFDFEYCNKCGFQNNSKLLLAKHIQKCRCEGDFRWENGVYICNGEGCGYNNTVLNTLYRHIRRGVHLYNKNINHSKCYNCGFTNKHKQVVQKHMNYCDCDGSYKWEDNMYICLKNQCFYQTETRLKMVNHSKICNGIHKFSSGEKKVYNHLLELGFIEGYDFVFNQTFSPLTDYSNRNLRPDFLFEKEKIIIEYDGIQHFKPQRFGGCSQEKAEESFRKQQIKDELKNQFCKEHNFKMVRISYKDFDKILTILMKELDEIIDWYER